MGWIKLYRTLLSQEYYNHSATVHLWVTLLLLAQHENTNTVFNNHSKILRAGQLITGRIELARLTGIPGSTVERILKKLEKLQQISVERGKKARLITIKNWQKYQPLSDHVVDTKRTQNGHKTDTMQEERIYINNKEIKNASDHFVTSPQRKDAKDITKELEQIFSANK